MSASATYLITGLCLLLAVLLPAVTRPLALSPPLVLLVVGVGLGLSPLADGLDFSLAGNQLLIQRVTEITVLVALMGVGLALDRPLDLLKPHSWVHWSPAWRLLGVAMPLCIAAVTLLGVAVGVPLGVALLLGAVLAPTDPVLASDVQVGGPGSAMGEAAEEEGQQTRYHQDPTMVTEQGEVRFALTAEAGLNDGLAFPFVYAALLVLAGGSVVTHLTEWVAWYVVAKVVLGVVCGVIVGRLLGMVAFRAPRPSLRLAEQGDPLLVIAALLTAYGLTEVVHGYGFLAVFACGMALRAGERHHEYHRGMHEAVDQLERLLTLTILIFLGIALSRGALAALDWRGVLVGVLLILLLRPLAAWLALMVAPRHGTRPGGTTPRGRATIAFFGVRGVGSLFYLSYAAGHTHLAEMPWLWATGTFTVALSVVVHGIASTPVISRLGEEPFGPAHTIG